MSFEMELSAEELRDLLQPARATRQAAVSASAPSAPAPSASARSLRMRATLGACAAIGVAAFAGLVAYRSARVEPVIPAVAAAAPSSTGDPSTPRATAVAEQPPVRFANPFDRSEVFEFPAGTTRAEARERVAELLMKRAQERGHARR